MAQLGPPLAVCIRCPFLLLASNSPKVSEIQMLPTRKLPEPSSIEVMLCVALWQQVWSQHGIQVALCKPCIPPTRPPNHYSASFLEAPCLWNQPASLILLWCFHVCGCSACGHLAPRKQAYQAQCPPKEGLLDPPRRANECQR